MQACVAQGGKFPPCSSVCILRTCLHCPTTLILLATWMTWPSYPHLMSQLCSSYLRDLERWLRKWRIAIIVWMNTAILFAKTGRLISIPQPLHLFGGASPLDAYRVISLDTQLSWSTQIIQCKKIAAHTLGVFGPLLNRRSGLYIGNRVLLYEQLIRPSGGLLLAPMSGNCWCFNPSDFALLPMHLGTLVTDKFTRILEFHSLPNTSDPEI